MPRANDVTLLMPSGALLAFGPCVLDTSTRSLTRNGEEVLLASVASRCSLLFTSRRKK